MNRTCTLLTMLVLTSACGAGSNGAAVTKLPDAEAESVTEVVDENSSVEEKSANESVELPEAVVTYQPDLPPLGQYSVNAACGEFSQDVEVTLADGETLSAAFKRLKSVAKKSGVKTGVISVPYYVDTVQCDRFRVSLTDQFHTLTVRGISGPNKEQPRFYCRKDSFDGTLPKIAGEWAFVRNKRSAGGADKKIQTVNFMAENLHIDGYAQWLYMPVSANIRIRGSYLHHATSNGITTPDINFHEAHKGSLNLEICGNEISHAGNGNAAHCLYLHRSERASFGDVIDVKFVDNVIHSCSYSSAYKSIANNNLVVGNRFYKHMDTDPTFSKRGTQMMVDIPSCGNSTEIRDNFFKYNRVDAPWMPGNAMVGIRNRANMFGCDIPQPPYLKEQVRLKDGSKHQCYRDPTVAECAIAGSKFWDENYWISRKEERSIPTYVKGNTFEVPLGAYKSERAVAVRSWGSIPYYKPSMNSKSCLLSRPVNWYERTMVYLSDNTYVNISKENAGVSSPMFVEPGVDSCGREYAGNPRKNHELVRALSGETYQSSPEP